MFVRHFPNPPPLLTPSHNLHPQGFEYGQGLLCFLMILRHSIHVVICVPQIILILWALLPLDSINHRSPTYSLGKNYLKSATAACQFSPFLLTFFLPLFCIINIFFFLILLHCLFAIYFFFIALVSSISKFKSTLYSV